MGVARQRRGRGQSHWRGPAVYHDTPLMVKGVLYTVTSLGQIAAINPGTGPDDLDVRSRQLEDRAVPAISASSIAASRIGPTAQAGAKRLLLGTHDAYLISVDAKTGALDTRSARAAAST